MITPQTQEGIAFCVKKWCESNPDFALPETVETRRLSGRDRVMSILEKSLSQSNSGKLCGTKNQ